MSDAEDARRHGRSPDEDAEPERAEEIYEEAEAEDVDPVTRREAIETELEDEGLSDEGQVLGEHIE
jgi:hypothetical protein